MRILVDDTERSRVYALADEYRRIALDMMAVRKLSGDRFTAVMLRLEAREVEIVDEMRALNLPPEILVSGWAPRAAGVAR